MESSLLSTKAKTLVILGVSLAGGALILFISRRRKQQNSKVDFGAFIERFELLPPPQPPPPAARHILTDLSFAIQDIFDVEGRVTGLGSSDWLNTHDPATQTAIAVSHLVSQGAKCIGKAIMDELGLSNTGENKHYGMPTNVLAPSRMPGGSSSGSAVAVAGGLVDFALGIDIDGSVSIPASFCGVLGFRSSHGIVSTAGVVPIARSLETVGWFARDPDVLHRVGRVLLKFPISDFRHSRRILIADDCFQVSSVPKEKSVGIVIRSFENLKGRNVVSHISLEEYIVSKVPVLKKFRGVGVANGAGSSSLSILCHALQMLKRHEFRMNHAEWVNATKPLLESRISEELNGAMKEPNDDIEPCLMLRNELRTAIKDLLKDDGILVIPTVPDLPPKRKTKQNLLAGFHFKACSLLSVAVLSGCCQVSVPLGKHEECPIAVSLLARYGADRFLLESLLDLYSTLQEEVNVTSKRKALPSTENQNEAAELRKEKGNAAFKERQWNKAANHYSEAIKLNDKVAAYYCNRAAACLELGRFEQAEEDCTIALNIDKQYVKAYLRRGTARERLCDFRRSLEDFQHAHVLEPTNKTASAAVNRLKKMV